jgi:hypothetical protein
VSQISAEIAASMLVPAMAWQGGAGVLDAGALAVVGRDAGAVGEGVVADAHAPAAAAADDYALEQRGSFAGRPRGAVLAAGGGVGGQHGLVALVLCPGQVTGMVIADAHGPVAHRLEVAVDVPFQVGAGLAASVDVGAGVGGIVQDVEHGVVGERLEVQLAGVRAALVAAGEGQARLVEGRHDGAGRAGGGEGVQQQLHCAADFGVGVEHDDAGGVVGQAGRQAEFQLAAAGLGQQASLHACPQEMQFAFGHGPLESQQEAVIEAGRVIQAVFVADQAVVVGADLDELLPVGRVAGQPGAFQPEHDPGAPERHLGDQVPEPFPVGG